MEAAAFPRPTPTNTVSRMSRAGSLLRCRELAVKLHRACRKNAPSGP